MDDFKSCALDDASLGVAVAVFVVETVENAQPAEAAGTCLRFFNRKRKAHPRAWGVLIKERRERMRTQHKHRV